MSQITQAQAQSLVDDLQTSLQILEEAYTQIKYLKIDENEIRESVADALHYSQEAIDKLNEIQESED